MEIHICLETHTYIITVDDIVCEKDILFSHTSSQLYLLFQCQHNSKTGPLHLLTAVITGYTISCQAASLHKVKSKRSQTRNQDNQRTSTMEDHMNRQNMRQLALGQYLFMPMRRITLHPHLPQPLQLCHCCHLSEMTGTAPELI